MNPLAALHRAPQRHYDGSRSPHRGFAGRDKPALSEREYMDELNQRLRRHPMYLEGMHFPDPQPGSTPMLAAALAWEGPWDCLGVFESVLQDVARDYELQPAG